LVDINVREGPGKILDWVDILRIVRLHSLSNLSNDHTLGVLMGSLIPELRSGLVRSVGPDES
jgi:hypothetical protein